ncbi:replicative DNA helicase [bacterium]|nr:replicative DNA helicase [bacterium]
MKASTLHDPKAERAVLAAYLTGKAATIAAGDHFPQEDWFFEPANQSVFHAVHDLFTVGERVDLVTVSKRLREMGALERVGGDDYLAGITEINPIPSQVHRHLAILREYVVRRQLHAAGQQITAMAADESMLLSDVLLKSDAAFHGAGDHAPHEQAMKLEELVARQSVAIKENPAKGEVPGLLCDFTELNRILGGFRRNNLIVLASRPGQGKTALALNLAFQVGALSEFPAIFFSLEMDQEQLVRRLVASEGTSYGQNESPPHRLDTGTLERGDMTPRHWHLFMHSRPMELLDAMYVVDSPNLSVLDMRMHARRMQAKHGGVAMVVVDYLQLVTSAGWGRRAEKRYEEIGAISRQLKFLAKDLKCPVLALSQLSREIEKRDDKRPLLSDLRESGSIEQDADAVIFIHNPSAGLREDHQAKAEELPVELHLLKNRHGETGIRRFIFDKPAQRFVEHPR